MRSAVLVMAALVLLGCSDDGGGEERITRIDGPAQVDDTDGDVTPEQSPDE